jgi:hypothetical protein
MSPPRRRNPRPGPLTLWALVGIAGLLACFQPSANAQVPPSISGTIYQDYNGNGARDTAATAAPAIDRGMSAVTVTLYDPSDNVAGTATSAANGSYSITPTLAGPYRIEFTGLPPGFRPAPHGSDNGSTVQFVPAGQATTVDLGILLPGEYCQNNPTLITSCYRFGNQLAPNGGGLPNSSVLPTVLSFTNASGAPVGTPLGPAYDSPAVGSVAIASQVGAVWGLAYARNTRTLYTSAFMKKHVGFGPGGPGAIYAINPATNTVVQTLSVPGVTSNPHDTANYVLDNLNTAWNMVGKASLGGMQISDDGSTLYVMNLENRTLYALNTTSGAVQGSSPVPTANVPLIAPSPAPVCNANDVRPFAVHLYRGALYVGMVCSAESTATVDTFTDGVNGCPANGVYDIAYSNNPAPAGLVCSGEPFVDNDGNGVYNAGDTRQLQAMVYTVDLATLAWSAAPVFQFPLNYPRGTAVADPMFQTDLKAQWRPWIAGFVGMPIAPNPNFNVPAYPQPWLTDLDFDDAGNMIIGLRDRYGDQIGNGSQSEPGSLELYAGAAAGDLLRACGTAGAWTLESNGSCGGVTTGGSTMGQGPGGGEFYFQDDLPAAVAGQEQHQELTSGALLAQPGAADLLATTVDPVYIPDQFFDTGFRWMSNTTGTTTRAFRVMNGDFRLITSYGKANGLGDIIALCDSAPVEIGNRVWFDQDRNGVQDSGEQPLAGIAVQLFNPTTGQVIAEALTDAGGNYYFSNASGTSTTSALYGLPISFGGTYVVRIDLTQSAITTPKYVVTVANTGSGQNTDINDSDGTEQGGFDQVTFAVGQAGDNNHTYDFGFSLAPTAITLESFTAQHSANGVLVRWVTSSEIDTFGFMIYRGELPDGSDAVAITDALIPAVGRGTGAAYDYADTQALPGATYYYWLEETETTGARRRYGPANTAPSPGGAGVYQVFIPALTN